MALSFSRRRELVSDKLAEGRSGDMKWSAYVVEMFDSYFIYRDDQRGAGRLYRSDYVIGETDNAVTITEPVEVIEHTVYETVSPAIFTLELEPASTAKGRVRYRGKAFEAGDYADKKFSITETEQNEAAADFNGPIAGNYEHKRGFLDGQLGELVGVQTDGTALFVEYDVPTWLHNLSGGNVKVSLEWSRSNKRIVGVALTETPRITDAVLTAAFTSESDDTDSGDSKEVRTGKQPMKKGLLSKIVALFSGLSSEELAELESVEDPKTEFTKDDELAAAKARIKELESSKSTFSNGSKIADAAAKFANDLVAADKATPAEVDEIVTCYSALADAEFGDKVEFSETASTGNLAAFIARENKRPALGLQAEQLPGKKLLDGAKPGDTADFAIDDLLDMTDLGKRAKQLKKDSK